MAWLGSNVGGGVGGGPRRGRFIGIGIQITRIHTTKKPQIATQKHPELTIVC